MCRRGLGTIRVPGGMVGNGTGRRPGFVYRHRPARLPEGSDSESTGGILSPSRRARKCGRAGSQRSPGARPTPLRYDRGRVWPLQGPGAFPAESGQTSRWTRRTPPRFLFGDASLGSCHRLGNSAYRALTVRSQGFVLCHHVPSGSIGACRPHSTAGVVGNAPDGLPRGPVYEGESPNPYQDKGPIPRRQHCERPPDINPDLSKVRVNVSRRCRLLETEP